MSRIGRAPIPVPDGVTVDIRGQHVRVEGPRGTLERTLPEPIRIVQTDGVLNLTRPTDRGPHRALHGRGGTLTRSFQDAGSRGVQWRATA